MSAELAPEKLLVATIANMLDDPRHRRTARPRAFRWIAARLDARQRDA
jgi:hypothetical protein